MHDSLKLVVDVQSGEVQSGDGDILVKLQERGCRSNKVAPLHSSHFIGLLLRLPLLNRRLANDGHCNADKEDKGTSNGNHGVHPHRILFCACWTREFHQQSLSSHKVCSKPYLGSTWPVHLPKVSLLGFLLSSSSSSPPATG